MQPGREDEPVAAGLRGRGQRIEARKDILRRRVVGQRVGAEEDVVAPKGERGAGGLVLVDEQVTAGDGRRQRGHVVQQVGLLEGHVAAKPGRCADVAVRGVIFHRAGTDGGRVDVGRTGDHQDRTVARRVEAELDRGAIRQRPEHVS